MAYSQTEAYQLTKIQKYYLGEEKGESVVLGPWTHVTYLNAEERAAFKVTIKDGVV